jgi:hypothetical protein
MTNENSHIPTPEDSSPQLDSLLRQWGANQTPSPNALRALHRSILEQAALKAPTITTPAHRQSHASADGNFAMLLSACTLACMALLVCLWQSSLLKQSDSRMTSFQPTITQLSESHFARLTGEMQRLFGDRLTWLAESSHEMSLGLESEPAHSQSSPYIAVRITLLRRTAGQAQWQTIWNEDIVTRPEACVEPPTANHPSQLRLWTYILPDGAVSIDTQLALPGVEQSRFDTMTVQHAGKPVRLHHIQRGVDDYEVWQTALVLSEPL